MGAQEKISVILDNEGPCTLNDNAQENTVALAKECGLGEEVGIKFYQALSNIDDIWGDYGKVRLIDPSYSSGHTLKVVLPFYKAMGATSQWLYDFAKNNLRLVPHIEQVLANLNRDYNAWMISTSYSFFIQAFCDRVGFPYDRARCTQVTDFDEVGISQGETNLLLRFMERVAQEPLIQYNKETGEVIKEHQTFYNHFTEFIWQVIYNLSVGVFLRQVHPVGQTQKREIVGALKIGLSIPKRMILYVGDSQTDVQVAQYLQGTGLTMMFNGKGQVCRYSDIMYIGEDARAIKGVADLFAQGGRQAVIDFCTCYGGLLAAVTPENVDELEKMSVKKRKAFRGVHIGELT